MQSFHTTPLDFALGTTPCLRGELEHGVIEAHSRF
jgi:hypothetical protein